MHLGLRELKAFFGRHRDDEYLVLATVVSTEGSTYRKPGAMMLIRRNAEFAGLISGGCLEGDLVEHARAVFEEGEARRVTYDLSGDQEGLWGLGLGCGGTVRLLLQRLDRERGFGPLPAVFAAIDRRSSCVLALTLEAGSGLTAGSFAVIEHGGEMTGDERLAGCLRGLPEAWDGPRRFRHTGLRGGGDDTVLLVRIDPSPRILVCGAGPDAVPVARQVDALGWECLVVDHRPAYAKAERFPASTVVIRMEPARLEEEIELDALDAALVMTHNLEHDTTYLRQLASRGLPYLGLLGPKARREELQGNLGIAEGVVRGPAGLDIGAELPEAIALSIVAEMHLELDRASRRDSGRG